MHSLFTITLGFCLALCGDAHMFLNHPMRFTNENNSPLNGPDAPSNYPCKVGSGMTADVAYAYTSRTQMAPGSSQSLELMGSATHGGGSCQLSISKDVQPTRGSVFKVIHTIQGGCPVRNTKGNLGDDANAIDPFHYDYKIPAGLEAGDYTFSWTWFNTVGNREFYQQCAPITLTGGGGVKARGSSVFDALPDLLVGNVADSPCRTKESTDVWYPNAGASIEVNNGTLTTGFTFNDVIVSPGHDISECYAPFGVSKAAASPAVVPVPVSVSVSSSSVPAALLPSSVAKSSSTLASLSVIPINTAPTSAKASSALASTSTPKHSSAAAATPSPAAVTAGSVSSSGTCAGASQPCSTVGGLVCIGGAQFGICDTNRCAVPQALAVGTVCNAGIITKRGFGLGLKRDGLGRVWVG